MEPRSELWWTPLAWAPVWTGRTSTEARTVTPPGSIQQQHRHFSPSGSNSISPTPSTLSVCLSHYITKGPFARIHSCRVYDLKLWASLESYRRDKIFGDFGRQQLLSHHHQKRALKFQAIKKLGNLLAKSAVWCENLRGLAKDASFQGRGGKKWDKNAEKAPF